MQIHEEKDYPSPLKKAWFATLSHVLLAYAMAQLHLTVFDAESLAFIDDHIEILKWITSKGGNKFSLRAYAIYALALTPFSFVAWFYFSVDARPRRPTAKLWHALIPAVYLAPMILFFSYAAPSSPGATGNFKSPLLRIIASVEIAQSVTITMVIWLCAGLAYFTVLPLQEILKTKRDKQ